MTRTTPKIITRHTLIYHLRCGNVQRVKSLLQRDVNLQGNYGKTALIYAAQNGYIECVQLLIEKGDEINDQRNSYETTALIEAVIRGHQDIVQLLIEKGADVNLKGELGFTALNNAAIKGHTDIVKILIDSGADVNAQNKRGLTALMWAAYRGHTDIVKILIEKGADYKWVFCNKNKYWQDAADLIKKILKELKEELCSAFLEIDGQQRHTRESLMELKYEELKAMVEGHPSRLDFAEDPDFDSEGKAIDFVIDTI